MSKFLIQLWLVGALLVLVPDTVFAQAQSDECLDELPGNVPVMEEGVGDCISCGACGSAEFNIPEITDSQVITDANNQDTDNMLFGLFSHTDIANELNNQNAPFPSDQVIGIGEYVDQHINVRDLLDCINLECQNNPFDYLSGSDGPGSFGAFILSSIVEIAPLSDDDVNDINLQYGDQLPDGFWDAINGVANGSSNVDAADIENNLIDHIENDLGLTHCIGSDGQVDFNCLIENTMGLGSIQEPSFCSIQSLNETQGNNGSPLPLKSTGGLEINGENDVFSTRIPGTALNVPNEISPGPSAIAAMNADININLYNGSISTGVPLHTLTANDLSIPVSLSMGGNGIKVNDLGTEVGHNWALNAGGQISRVVKNLPDEYTSIEREVGRGRGPGVVIKPCVTVDLGGTSVGVLPKPVDWNMLAPNVFRFNYVYTTFPIVIPTPIGIPVLIPVYLYITVELRLNIRMKPDYYTMTEKGVGYWNIDNAAMLQEVAGQGFNDGEGISLAEPGGPGHESSKIEEILSAANGRRQFEDQLFLSSTLSIIHNFLQGVQTLFGELDKPYTNLDLQADEFNYSFPGYSGTFVIKPDGEVISRPANGLKITCHTATFTNGNDPVDSYVSGFEVETPEGIRYSFGQSAENFKNGIKEGVEMMETTTYNLPNYVTYPKYLGPGTYSAAALDQSSFPYSASLLCYPRALLYGSTYENLYTVQRSPRYTSSWKMTSVTSLLTQERISFEYGLVDNLEYRSSKQLTHKFPNFPLVNGTYFTAPIHAGQNPVGVQEYTDLKGEFTYTIVENKLDKQRLTRISTDRLEDIEFIYEKDRGDVWGGDKLLTKVNILRSNTFYQGYAIEYDDYEGSVAFKCKELDNPEETFPVATEGWNLEFGEPHRKWFFDLENVRFKTFNFNFFRKALTRTIRFPITLPTIPQKANNLQDLDEYGSLLYVKGLETTNQTITDQLRDKEQQLYRTEFNRSFLKSVKQIGNQNGQLPYLDLEYYGNIAELPKRFSVRQDQWGFFNRKNNSILPKLKYQDFLGNVMDDYPKLTKMHFGFLKDPNSPFVQGRLPEGQIESAKIGALKNIIFPTGGTTELDYELNDWIESDGQIYSNRGAGLRIFQKKESAGVDGPTKTTGYFYETPTVVNLPIWIENNPYDRSDFDVDGNCSLSFLLNIDDVLGTISNDNSSTLDITLCPNRSLPTLVKSCTYPQNEWHMNGSGYVGYATVEELIGTSDDNIGRVRYSFLNPSTDPPLKTRDYTIQHETNSIISLNDSWTPSNINWNNQASVPDFFQRVIPISERYGVAYKTESFDKLGSLVQSMTKQFSSSLRSDLKCNASPSLSVVEGPPRYRSCYHEIGLNSMAYDRKYPGSWLANTVFNALQGLLLNESNGMQAVYQLLVNDAIIGHPYKKVVRDFNFNFDVFFIDDFRVTDEWNEVRYSDGSVATSYTSYDYFLVDQIYYRPAGSTTTFGNGQTTSTEFTYLSEMPSNLAAEYDNETVNQLMRFGRGGYSQPIISTSSVNGTPVEGSAALLIHRNSPTGSGLQFLPSANWSLINGKWQLTNYNTAWHASTIPTESQVAEYLDVESFAINDHTFFGKQSVTLNSNLLPLLVTAYDDDDDDNVFVKQYIYSQFYQELEESIDPNGIRSTFIYDEFRRLEKQVSGNGRVTADYDYSLNPAILTTQITYDDGTPSQGTVQKFNGLGMPTSTQRHDGALLKEYTYNDFFQVRQKKIIGKGSVSYSYEESPLQRLLGEKYGAENLTTYTHSADFSTLSPEYLNNPEFFPYSLVRITDANGQEENGGDGIYSTSVNDALGRSILGISQEGGETYSEYDDFSRPKLIINPIGEQYTYTYNNAGLLATKSMPQTRTQSFWYDKKYREVATLSNSGALTTTQYDGFGRPLNKYLYASPGSTPSNIATLEYLDASAFYTSGNLFSQVTYETGKTWTSSAKNFELTSNNEIGGEINATFIRDELGRARNVTTVYPDGIAVESETTFNDANLPVLNEDTYSGGIALSVITRTEFDDVLRPFNNYLNVRGSGEKLVSRYFYNQEDQLEGKMLGNVSGNTFLQRVAYKYDPSTLWLTDINSVSESDCVQEEVPALCRFSADYEILCWGQSACSRINGIVIDGQFHALPSTVDLLRQNTTASLDILINQLLTQLGYEEATFSQSTESDIYCNFEFELLNFSGSTFALQFSGRGVCDFALEFEPGDCCYPDDGIVSNETPWYGVTTSGPLYAQKMTYDKLDIERIDYAGDCFFSNSSYDFTYDYNHRLTQATHILHRDGRPINNGYSTEYSYDPAGNITSLKRRGRTDDLASWNGAQFAQIDDLIYNYSAGQLNGIVDNATGDAQTFGFPLKQAAYQYDGAGNITGDGIRSMNYNAFNLPRNIEIVETGMNQALTYLSSGALYRRQGEEERIYLGGLEIVKDESGTNLEALQFGDGRVILTGGGARFQYKIADHLGNTVVLFEDKDEDGIVQDLPNDPANSEVLQRELYYPFGHNLRGTNPVQPETAYNYAYNGKEKIGGTGLYAYGFRYYDPLTARFTGVDPISDQFAFVSVYNYAENRPVRYIDLHGLQKADPPLVRDATAPRPGNYQTSFHSSFFVQYEGRASAMITGSLALGAMFDTQGNIGIYYTYSYGAGITLGASTSWTVGGSTADRIYDLEGTGLNWGAYATAGWVAGAQGAIETNFGFHNNYDYESGIGLEALSSQLKNVEYGITVGIPLEWGVFGAGGGTYIDVSNTKILASMNVFDAFDSFLEKYNSIFQDTYGRGLTDKESKDLNNLYNDYRSQIEECENSCENDN